MCQFATNPKCGHTYSTQEAVEIQGRMHRYYRCINTRDGRRCPNVIGIHGLNTIQALEEQKQKKQIVFR